MALKLVSVEEAAEFLRVHPVTIYRKLKKGGVPGAFRIGRHWRIELGALERFLEAQTRRR